MTTFDHHLPFTGSVGQVTHARGSRASIVDNAFVRLFAVLVVIAAGAAGLTLGIAFLLDLVVPVIFANELHALAALFPQLPG